MAEEKKKFCFVVCPVGPRGSEIRDRMDGIFNEVIAPVAEEFGYRAEIAIHDKSPGIVTERIVTKLIEADLVIVDLHGHNGNVMYEVGLALACRHSSEVLLIRDAARNVSVDGGPKGRGVRVVGWGHRLRQPVCTLPPESVSGIQDGHVRA